MILSQSHRLVIDLTQMTDGVVAVLTAFGRWSFLFEE